MRRLSLIALFSLAVLASALSTMHAPAVDANGQGMLTTIEARAIPGNGNVYVDIEPYISVDTQESARTASRVAARLAGVDVSAYDLLYKVVANAEVIDGPSGGAVLTVLAYSEFTGRKPRGDMTITGTIEPDGSIGKISGVMEKAKAAASQGMKVFLVPRTQSIQDGIDLTTYAPATWGMQVVEISQAEDAVRLAFTVAGSAVNSSRLLIAPMNLTPIPASRELLPMKRVAENEELELLRTLDGLPKGNDSALIAQEVQASLNASRQMLERGYYYSAANELFLTKMALDSIGLENSTESMSALISELDAKLGNVTFVQKNERNAEWVAAAQMRWHWAKQQLESISKNGAPTFEDYAAAQNWYDAAVQLNAEAAKIEAEVPLNELGVRQAASEAMSKANASLYATDAEALRHLNAAQSEFSEGDYLAAMMDASFSQAMSEGSRSAREGGGTLPNESMSSFNTSVWAMLYYGHALYNVQEANRTNEYAYSANAVKLRLLAKLLSERIPAAYADASVPSPSVSPSPQLRVSAVIETTQPPQTQKYVVLFGILLLFAAVAVGGFVLSRSLANRRKPPSNADRERELDDLLLERKISEKTYERLRRKYEAAVAPKPPRLSRKK
ncbi:Lon protease [Candidatus Norongarragalina meridionalis]|nr:Lon protease [Candidatus Norongarragalina meridionalis]